MNIVYKFTSKVTGKFYIGSKSECGVVNNTIICSKYGFKYYSSSSCDDFWQEVEDGNMLLEVLEVVGDRSSLLEREAFYQIQEDAKNNPMCYNKVIATDIRNVITEQQWGCVVNIFRETLIDKTKNASAVARLNTAALEEGFSNYGEKVLQYLKYYKGSGTYLSVDKKYNRKCYSKRFLKDKNLEDFDSVTDINKIQNLLIDGASFLKACELCGYKDYVVVYQHGFELATNIDVKNRIAINNGFSNREALGAALIQMYLEGKSFNDMANQYDCISSITASRIIQEEVIKRLGTNAT